MYSSKDFATEEARINVSSKDPSLIMDYLRSIIRCGDKKLVVGKLYFQVLLEICKAIVIIENNKNIK